MGGKKDIVEQALKLIFSGSKAVNESGIPTRVYHGTTHDLPIIKPGSYFTEDPSEASAYTFWTDLANADKRRDRYSIITAPEMAGKRLKYSGIPDDIEFPEVGQFYATDNGIMQYNGKGRWKIASDVGADYNSFDPSDYTIGVKPHDRLKYAQEMVDEHEEAIKSTYPGGVGGNVIPAYLNIKNPKEMPPLEGNRFGERLGADPKWVANEIDKLKSQGYDSIVTTSDDLFYRVNPQKPPKHYIIFEPTQVKSAVGNSGEYDFTNPDITKAEGGRVAKGGGGIIEDALRLARDVGGATNENPQVFMTDAQGHQYDAHGRPIQPAVTQDQSNSSAQETKEPQRENINTMFNVAPKNYYSDVQPFLDYAMTPVDRPGMPSEPDLVDVMRIATQVASEGQPTETRGEGNLARRREEFINNLYGVNPDQPNSPSANQAWIANRVVDFSPWALGEVAHDIPYEAGRTGDYGTAVAEGGLNALLTTPVLGAVGRGVKKGYEYAKKFPLIPAAAAGAAGLTGGSDEAEAGKSDIVKKALRALAEDGGEAVNAGIRAYQGSPHDFAAERLVRLPSGESQYIVGAPNVLPDLPEGAELIQDFPLGRMRMDKIGTGEGAQAYGHGLYAAEGEPVALDYRNALSEININGAPINKENPEHEAALNIWHYGNIENAKIENQQSLAKYETLWDNLSEKEKSKPENQRFFGTLINSLKSNLNLYGMHERGENILPAISSSGKVYEINIAADPAHFLDWDKPLAEQSKQVRDALKKHYGFTYDSKEQQGWTGKDVAQMSAMQPEHVKELTEAGIPGIRYLDAGSRGAGDGQRNYVVFDDRLISIIRKYGIAGASTMLGYNLMENLTPEQAKAASSADDFYQKTTNTKMDGGRVTGGNTYDNDPSVAHALALTSEY